MTQPNKKTFRKVIAIAMMVVSGFFAINVLIQNLHGIFAIIAVIIVVFLLKTAEATFAADAAHEYKNGNHWLATGYLALCTVLFLVSISGSTIYWFGNHKKDSAKLDEAKAFLLTKEHDVLDAKTQLSKCKPGHVTKCIRPLTEVVHVKETERDAAAAKVAKLAEIAGMDKAWKEVAAFVGLDEEENANNLEIFRDFLLSALADIIAMIFIAQAENSNRQPQPRSRNNEEECQVSKYDENSDFQPKNAYLPTYLPTYSGESQGFEDDLAAIRGGNAHKDLMADVNNNRNILIIGAQQGAGKSTMLGHLAAQRLQQGGKVIVFDPHYDPEDTSWHPRCEIIGAGRDYKAIEEGLIGLVALMDKRFKERREGKRDNHYKVTIFMDEMKTVVKKVNAGEYFENLLTEGRKANIFFVGAGHSTRVGALGLSGMGDLFQGFDSILYLSSENGQRNFKVRRSVFDENGKEISAGIYNHPGRLSFNQVSNQVSNRVSKEVSSENGENWPKFNLSDLLTQSLPVDIEKKPNVEVIRTAEVFQRMKADDEEKVKRFSWNGLTTHLFNNVGKNYIAKAKRNLDELNIDYSMFESQKDDADNNNGALMA